MLIWLCVHPDGRAIYIRTITQDGAERIFEELHGIAPLDVYLMEGWELDEAPQCSASP